MKVERDACEVCKTETADKYLEIGWIQVEKAIVTVSKGRLKDRTAKSGYANASEKTLDFCSWECLKKWINAL